MRWTGPGAWKKPPDARLVMQALSVREHAYLEAPDGAIAVAGAEVVAASMGYPGAPLPPGIATWIDGHREAMAQVSTDLAISAVVRVADDDSELAELWSEAGDTTWHAELEDLRSRLGRR